MLSRRLPAWENLPFSHQRTTSALSIRGMLPPRYHFAGSVAGKADDASPGDERPKKRATPWGPCSRVEGGARLARSRCDSACFRLSGTPGAWSRSSALVLLRSRGCGTATNCRSAWSSRRRYVPPSVSARRFRSRRGPDSDLRS